MGLRRQAKIGFKGTQKFSNGKILYVFSAPLRKNMGIWVPAICIIQSLSASLQFNGQWSLRSHTLTSVKEWSMVNGLLSCSLHASNDPFGGTFLLVWRHFSPRIRLRRNEGFVHVVFFKNGYSCNRNLSTYYYSPKSYSGSTVTYLPKVSGLKYSEMSLDS